MNEALTRAQLIDPVLIDKGWTAGFCQGCYWIPEDGVWSPNRATLFNYIRMKFGSIDEAMKGFDCPAPEKVVEFYGNLQENLYAVGRIVEETGSGA